MCMTLLTEYIQCTQWTLVSSEGLLLSLHRIYICVCVCGWVHACMCACMHACVCMHAHVRARACVRACVCVCTLFLLSIFLVFEQFLAPFFIELLMFYC